MTKHTLKTTRILAPARLAVAVLGLMQAPAGAVMRRASRPAAKEGEAIDQCGEETW